MCIQHVNSEDMSRRELDETIKSVGRPITIDIVNMRNEVFFTAKNVIGCEKVVGNQKADFALVTEAGPAIFISHKKHGDAVHFLQYSGISIKAGEKINSHCEVQKFLSLVAQHVSRVGLKTPCMKTIKDKMLMRYALFGSNYVFGRDSFDANNCQLLAQGDPILREHRLDYRFELVWSGKWAVNGELVNFCDNYEPVLGAIPQNDRHFLIENVQYRGRVGIYPADFFKNRQNLIVL